MFRGMAGPCPRDWESVKLGPYSGTTLRPYYFFLLCSEHYESDSAACCFIKKFLHSDKRPPAFLSIGYVIYNSHKTRLINCSCIVDT